MPGWMTALSAPSDEEDAIVSASPMGEHSGDTMILAQPQFSLRPSSVSSHGGHHTHSGRALHTSALASEIVAHILADAWEQL